jgi:predicted regulator of Ras-like GTPase activity (Roadblock/LC7/MglB family)
MTNIQYVLSEEINKAVESSLNRYLKDSRASCVLLLAKSGHLISQAGFTSNFNVQSIAALIGGIFTSTQALAKLVAEEKFKVMFQEGRNWNVYFCLIADQFILATVFDKSTVVGMIRHTAAEAERTLSPVLAKAIVEDTDQAAQALSQEMGRGPAVSTPSEAQPEESLPDFNRAVEDALSKLFS